MPEDVNPEVKEHAPSGRVHPLVRCVDCGVDLGEHALGNLCVPCQKVWAKRIANPKNFEGGEFKWQADWYVPVQMATGHMMVHCISATARAAWDTFTMHYWTKRERMAQGWRVKRIRITPDWSAKQMRAGATAPQAGSRSGVSSADHAPSSPNDGTERQEERRQ